MTRYMFVTALSASACAFFPEYYAVAQKKNSVFVAIIQQITNSNLLSRYEF